MRLRMQSSDVWTTSPKLTIRQADTFLSFSSVSLDFSNILRNMLRK